MHEYCIVLPLLSGGDGNISGQADIQTDQGSRVQDFHMVKYGYMVLFCIEGTIPYFLN